MKILIGSEMLCQHIRDQDNRIVGMAERNKRLEQQVLDAKDETIKILNDCKEKLGQ